MKNSVVTFAILTFTIFLLLSSSIQAQHWTDEEQELLDYLELCWEVWMEAVEKKDPEIWLKKSNAAENFTYWWTAEGAPHGMRAIRRDWDSISKGDITWIDFRPVAIRIHDNVGIVHFYGYWKANTKDGPATTEHMRTEVFIKDGGKWSFIGGHSTPVSSKDSDPYK